MSVNYRSELVKEEEEKEVKGMEEEKEVKEEVKEEEDEVKDEVKEEVEDEVKGMEEEKEVKGMVKDDEDEVKGMVKEVVKVEEGSYLVRRWSDDLDPKLPQTTLTQQTIRYASIQEDPPNDPWTPTHLSQLLNTPTSTCRRLASLGGRLWCGDCHTCLIDGNKYTCFDPDV
ncbi:hypothetical protein Pmani_017839, partial [Petrolisthes manimaculis]